MKKIYVPCKVATKAMTTSQLRESFLIEDIFNVDEITLYYTDCDRAIVGSACPSTKKLILETADELRSPYFCARRELGVLNIGAKGIIRVDEQTFELDNLETLYIGRGSKCIEFSAQKEGELAEFYLVSYPAHKEYPTTKSAKGEANILNLGSQEKANVRTINQAICENRIQSSQLVMGYTALAEGSVWNTMPAHTHERRSEVYMYFNIQPDECVFHYMGTPDETRHIVVKNKQVVISPSWSIHSGCGTRNYTFCWGMGGENQRFDDMDEAKELK